jgi:hypothetical protein
MNIYEVCVFFGFFVFPRPGIFKAGLLIGCFFNKQAAWHGVKNKEVPQGTKIEALI